jgi:hypothetical protein
MKSLRINLLYFALVLLLVQSGCTSSPSKGLKSITEQELRQHLEFIAAPEIMGRPVPSQELEIITLYLGNWAKYAGLKPILSDSSYYQTIPIAVTSVSKTGTRITVTKGSDVNIFYFGKTFGGNFGINGSFSGKVVFAGLGLSDPESGWDDLKNLDLKGKVVVILDARLPDDKIKDGKESLYRITSRVNYIREKGAIAVFSVISQSRQDKIDNGIKIFDNSVVGRMIPVYDSQRTRFSSIDDMIATMVSKSSVPFVQADISHEVAAGILGTSKEDITQMFKMIREGKKVNSKDLTGVRIRLDVEMESFESTTRNVLAVIEGSDDILKDEYVVICAHHDHLGVRNGEIIAGADDNGTGTVALIEIAEALMTNRPKRSTIIAWFTGEERGLHGSNYFINNCPVPVEKISACLNMDMLGRNPADSLFLIAPELLSSGLDAAINKVNKKYRLNFGFDYRYSDIGHPQRAYFRSDHYPFIRFGIPSAWFFGGFHPDYHTPRDVLATIDYRKLHRSTQLVYLTAYELGNQEEMLTLDVNPAVTTRGKQNVTERSLFQSVK